MSPATLSEGPSAYDRITATHHLGTFSSAQKSSVKESNNCSSLQPCRSWMLWRADGSDPGGRSLLPKITTRFPRCHRQRQRVCFCPTNTTTSRRCVVSTLIGASIIPNAISAGSLRRRHPEFPRDARLNVARTAWARTSLGPTAKHPPTRVHSNAHFAPSI